MARRNIRKQMMGNAMALTTTGMALGVGAQAATMAGGTALPGAAAGVGAFSSYMPIVGTTMGSGIALNALQQLSNQLPRTRRRRR